MSTCAYQILLAGLICAQALGQVRKQAVTDTTRYNPTYEIKSTDFFSRPSNSMGDLAEPGKGPRTSGNPATGLNSFGFDLFTRDPATLSSLTADAMTLPHGYELGPGDRLGVYLLGTVQQNIDLVVNLEGKVFLPPVGVIQVWGMNMSEFHRLLLKKLSQYYDNFHLNIMLLQPKNVMVAVVGDVQRPGKYVLSALNTVLDAIIMAGGPTDKGSIRDIQLIRDSTVVASVDLYQFLMNGTSNEDAFLQAGDRIYVPIAQDKVTVDGEVNRPALFDLKPGLNERLSDVIELAGGFTDLAYIDRIEVSRLTERGQRSLAYVDYNRIAAGDSTANLLLRNEDHVKVYSKLEQVHERTVAIYGEIRNPGTYPLQDNMHVSDLILQAGNLTRKAYMLEAEVAKVDPGEQTVYKKILLNKMENGRNGDTDPVLSEDDQVFVRRIPKWEVGLLVEVKGEVVFPGKYAIVKDKTYLSDVIKKAGGFTDDAFPQEALVIRESSRIRFDKEYERLSQMSRDEMTDMEYQYLVMRQNSSDVKEIVVDFNKLIKENDRSQDIVLEDGDVVVVPKAPTVVTVTGSVAKPGGVAYREGQGFDYYLTKAGGPSGDASLGETKIVKVTGEVLDDEDVDILHAGDIIWVPRKNGNRFWPVALQSLTVMAQLASIFLVIETAARR